METSAWAVPGLGLCVLCAEGAAKLPGASGRFFLQGLFSRAVAPSGLLSVPVLLVGKPAEVLACDLFLEMHSHSSVEGGIPQTGHPYCP